MSSLKEELEARRAGGREESPSCYSSATGRSVFAIEFRPDPHRRIGFPMSCLCHYSLDPLGGGELEAPERLSIGFSTADVIVTGARLGKLVEALREHSLEWVAALDPRYAGTIGKQPWVAAITIARIDKSVISTAT